MIKFKITPYGKENDIMLVGTKETEKKIDGLPPTWSQVITMKSDDLDNLIEVIYAYKRRDKELQPNG